MPSPKWKLVVDVGEPESIFPQGNIPHIDNATVANSVTIANGNDVETGSNDDIPPLSADGLGKDSRIDPVISLLGEYMPSDPSSHIASFLPGFMSLRLMLLRPSKTPEEDEMVRTMLGSYSSYCAGGRSKNDIAIMLARDYMFLAQQQPPKQQQTPEFLGRSPSNSMMQQPPKQQQQQQTQEFLGRSPSNSMMQSNGPTLGYSFFGLGQSSGSNSSFHNSPALAPIPMSGSAGDSVSIVSM